MDLSLERLSGDTVKGPKNSQNDGAKEHLKTRILEIQASAS